MHTFVSHSSQCGLEESVSRAKDFISMAIENSLDIGRGCGPTNPMGEIYRSLGMV